MPRGVRARSTGPRQCQHLWQFSQAGSGAWRMRHVENGVLASCLNCGEVRRLAAPAQVFRQLYERQPVR
jgi:hypothetical protein